MQLIINDNFPNPLSAKVDKDTKAFGTSVAKAILASTYDYREKRNKIFSSNRAYAEGKQDMKPILDMVEIDGKSTYTNISIKPGAYAKKFEKIVVDGYMESRQEFPRVTALSAHIQERKEKRKSDAQFRMEYGGVLGELSQEAGVPLTDPSEYTPESKEDLELYYDINDKEKEELLLQETLTFAFNDIDIEKLKRRILTDQFQVNLFGLYEYIDNNGREVVDYIQGEDCIYSNCFTDDFSEIPEGGYAGRLIRMPLAKLRARFALKGLDEKELHGYLKKFAGRFGNASLPRWTEDYRFRDVRPYDNFMVEVLHVWWSCNQVLEYTEGKDRYGRSVFDVSDKLTPTGKSSDGRKNTGRVYPLTAYEGYFLGGGCYCLEWAEQTNQLRDGNYKQELICPFIFHMVDNHGGMLSPSPIENVKDYFQIMDLNWLKIKQVIAKTPPPGLSIDIRSLMNIDLGDGEIEPIEVLTIRRQTGDLYYNSKDEEGNIDYKPPVVNEAVDIGASINGFIVAYNLAQQNVRETLGINEFRDGSASAARIGFKFAQSQAQASNTATVSNYMAYVKATTKLTRQMGIRIWDALKYGNPNKGYLKLLGEKNAKLIQAKDEVVQSIYDFKYELGISSDERAYLEQNIERALASGTLYMEDVMRIRRTMDAGYALAERMLSYLTEKRRKERVADADVAQRSAAEYNAQAAQATEQARGQNIQLQLQYEQAKEKAKGDNDQIQVLLKGAMDMITESFKTGTPIPPMYEPLVSLALQNAAVKTSSSSQQAEQEQQQLEQQQAQQQMGQELQAAVDSGEMTEEEALSIAQQNGLA
jgi:hypothetical protein